MSLVLARIDQRLIHGIVVTQWAGHTNAKRLMVVDDFVSKEFANDLFISGRTNFLIAGESNLKIISNKLTSQDLVIVTSLSGNTPGIRDAIKTLKISNVPICSVTSFGTNYLTEHADYSLYYEAGLLPNVNGQEPIYSMTCLNLILSILSRKYKEFILFDE
ncbi:hypothetical protein FC19_GL001179 [Liquorilactobacillus aquaticus DSM 21051]|uniref:SIS domain-containing protein n=1 Tax=Liquorilactobacillus aquaticus DSM 21051 TaxID=1423725 RepID=A0A0R2D6I5_9LACO|nr:PTS sugar transporter subunit IIB [Liquorilactobacillus aquaticus]KRM96107.1 hypothetical protein FC19_GL001179 [Liquorilactobacillus aquaticus DSM 21051]